MDSCLAHSYAADHLDWTYKKTEKKLRHGATLHELPGTPLKNMGSTLSNLCP